MTEDTYRENEKGKEQKNKGGEEEEEREEGSRVSSRSLRPDLPSTGKTTNQSIFLATVLTCRPRVTEEGTAVEDRPPPDDNPRPVELSVRFVIFSNAPERERKRMM